MNTSLITVVTAAVVVLALTVVLRRAIARAAIAVAGADYTELKRHPVDRGYYVGLGFALLLTATVSTIALVSATSVAFGVPLHSPSLVVAGLVYFLLLLAFDRWLVSDQTAGFAPDPDSRRSAVTAWFRHFVVELVKVLPRVGLAVVASLLFADFILLQIFSAEIGQQIKAMDRQEQLQFEASIQQNVKLKTAQKETTLKQAEAEKAKVQEEFVNQQAAIRSAQETRDKSVAEAKANGAKCRQVATRYTYRDPRTGQQRTGTSYSLKCDKPIQDAYDLYNTTVAKYTMKQADVDAKKAQIDKQYDVPALQQYIADGAKQDAVRDLAASAPEHKDGLLVRMRALDLLVTKPTGTCPPSGLSDPANADNVACVSRYSARAASLLQLFRWWLLSFELAPITMKLVTAITKRRGYATIMAAKDEKARAEGLRRIGQLGILRRIALEKDLRRERFEMELSATEEEMHMRELARQQHLSGLARIRRRLRTAAGRLVPHTRHTDRVPIQREGADADTVEISSFGIPQRRRTRSTNQYGERIVESENELL